MICSCPTVGAGFPKGSAHECEANLLENLPERIIFLDKLINCVLAVMAFVENFAQAVAAFFKGRIFPVLKPVGRFLRPVAVFFEKVSAPVFNYLKGKPVLTLVIIGIVYFIGIAAVLYPIFGNIYTLSKSKVTITEYADVVAKMDTSEIEQRFKQAKIYNADLASGIYNDGYERSLCSINDLVCFVEVPSVDIYLPVYYGTSEPNLQKGAAWLENTSLPVDGQSVHSVISGHTGLPAAELFTKLDQTKEGEIFYLHVLNKIFAYKIDNIFVVYPNQSSYLNIVPDKDYCTLLTCTPYGINDRRLLVRGERIPYTPSNSNQSGSTERKNIFSNGNVNEELDKQISHQVNIVIGIVLVSIIVYVFACIWLMGAVKKPALVLDFTDDDAEVIESEEEE